MKKVLVAMSGGVDSSVSAYLLQKAGYEVEGLTFTMFSKGDICAGAKCGALEAAKDASVICDYLGIKHHSEFIGEDFKTLVMDYFCDEYLAGRTPNPCVQCNRYIKFSKLVEKADELGIKYISTGHYGKLEEKDGIYHFLLPTNMDKDQSYVLHYLGQNVLSRLLLPLSDYETKAEVRAVAEEAGLKIAKKPDSQDICFIPDKDYVGFIKKHRGISAISGDFVDEKGNIIGQHEGFFNYTIGQRRGLKTGFLKRVYVIGKNAEKNQVVLGNLTALETDRIFASDLSFTSGIVPKGTLRCQARLRYSQKMRSGTLTIEEGNRAVFLFDEKVQKVAAGQSIVFYDGKIMLGGGIIE